MRILIVRHGDPDYANDTLTEKGHREAKLLAEKLSKEKIDYIYCSPLGRAKDTCAYTAKALGMEDKVVIKDWLQEFGSPFTLPDGTFRHILWDMLPEVWTERKKFFTVDEWHQEDFLRTAEVVKPYRAVTEALDELLAKHGYTREGRRYTTEQGHTETIAFFCHFGLEMMLLSHLCNISPIVLTHQFVALPTSVTTLYTEERRKGIVTFRCCGYGDVGHLYAGGEELSKSARFCEVFENEERHD